MIPALMRSVMVLTADESFFSDFLHAYTPRRICMNSESAVIWLSVLSDGLIALSYFSIPLALLVFVKRRRDLAFNWMFLLFASFIFACGATHAMGVWAIWQPLYKLDGTVKLATGLLSAATAVLLWRLIPTLVRLPSPSDLAQANATLTQLRDELEQRVELRTRELAEAGERERVARGDAVRANRAKDEFLATLSHELRTPLHSIVGWTEVMSQVNLDEQERERAVSVIRRNAAIQAQLIEDMLDLSRITSGKLRLDVRDVDLKSVIDAARETIEPAAAAKGIHVRAPDVESCPWRGDPDRLQQAVWNLLSNAVKFTPQGGEVTVGLELADSEIVISVSDTGPGLQPDIQPFVFDRFRQGDSSVSRKHGGLGLGLAIVRHIVELHGGTAHAGQVKSGSGAMFSIRLPKQARLLEAQASQGPAVVQARSTAARPLPSTTLLKDVRVLVVDDELDPQALARMVFEQHGATVTTASSAAEARTALDRGAFDVLVSDIGMPGEDGFSLLRTIRKRPAAAGGAIPALALTAFARAKDRQDAIEVGFQEYLSKPVELTELLWAIARLIGRAGDGAG